MAFTQKEITQMLDALRDRYPEAGCALVHQNTYPVSYTHLDVYKRQLEGFDGKAALEEDPQL